MKKLFILILFLVAASYMSAQSALNDRLLTAVKSNRFDSVKILVEQGADVNYCDSNKATIVMWAALKGDLNMVKYLVGKGADVKRKGIIYGDVLTFGNITGIAASSKNLPLLKYLVEECKIPYNDKELDRAGKIKPGWDALVYGLRALDTAIINYYLRKDTLLKGLEIYSIGSFLHINYDTLILKRIHSDHSSFVKEKVINPILINAVKDNKYELIKQLLYFHPDLNCLDEDTLSPLALSILYNHRDIATLLIENGTIKNFLYDLQTAALAGKTSTGNGSRLRGQPSPAPSRVQARVRRGGGGARRQPATTRTGFRQPLRTGRLRPFGRGFRS